MSEVSYDTIIRGFKSVVSESDNNPDYVRVELYEDGRGVYIVEVPLMEGEKLSNDDVIDRVSDSAIDLFEAQRGTLGQGAGVMNKDSATKKKSYYNPIVRNYEEWYRNLQGTTYEDGAISLIEKMMDINKDIQEKEQQINELYDFSYKLLMDMDKLDLERMKSDRGYKDKIIVIKSHKLANFHSSNEVSEFLSMFKGHELESMIISKMKEYLDLQNRINEFNETLVSYYDSIDDIKNQMKEITILAAESNLSNNVDMEIMKYPNMANDIAELMEDVEVGDKEEVYEEFSITSSKKSRKLTSLDEEILKRLKDAGGFVPQENCEYNKEDMGRLQAEMLVRLVNHSGPYEDGNRTEFFVYELTPYGEKALETKVSYKISANEEIEIDELGEMHDGLQPAEVEPDGMPFNEGEKIELTKPVEVALWGGKIVYPKGTKGHIDSLFDRHGDYYKVMTDKGKLIKVKWNQMKRTRKKN